MSAAHPSLLAYHNTELEAVYDLYELSAAERALVDAEYESPTGVAG